MKPEQREEISKKWFSYKGFKTSLRKLAKENGVSKETIRNIVRKTKPKEHCLCCGCPASNVQVLREHYARKHPGFCVEWLTKEK